MLNKRSIQLEREYQNDKLIIYRLSNFIQEVVLINEFVHNFNLVADRYNFEMSNVPIPEPVPPPKE
jgi:hypothetical protein